MKRIIRARLTKEEAAKYKRIREQIDQELPELIARHNQRIKDKLKRDRRDMFLIVSAIWVVEIAKFLAAFVAFLVIIWAVKSCQL